MMLIMLYALVYEVDVKGELMLATAAVKSQLDHFNSGEWQELWADAQGHPNLEQLQKTHQGVQGAEAAECAQLAQAKHFDLNMQLQDVRQCLTDPSLLSFAEPGTQAKMHAAFERLTKLVRDHHPKRRFGGFLVFGKETSFFQTY